MAEILGIVAGGLGIASFVVQIGDSLIKLKGFADSMNNAPEELTYLIHGVEDLHRILKAISIRAKKCSIPDGEDDIIDNSLLSCHRAAQDLYQITKTLERDIIVGSRKARFRFALKKQLLRDLRTRVEEAKQNVLLALAANTM
jgi:hypothetical protein